MPGAVQWLTIVDPLRYYLVVIRDVFLKGGGVANHPGEMGMMVLFGGGALVLSMIRLR
jgi:ABC-2 type transport system permease protein